MNILEAFWISSNKQKKIRQKRFLPDKYIIVSFTENIVYDKDGTVQLDAFMYVLSKSDQNLVDWEVIEE